VIYNILHRKLKILEYLDFLFLCVCVFFNLFFIKHVFYKFYLDQQDDWYSKLRE
jgi:hypothetical protein